MPFLPVRDLNVYYELHGAGERVLYISGTGGDLRANPLRGTGVLEQRFEVAMYDQRGLGQTSKPDADYTMADYADDAAALLDALGWDRAHVVGVSFGGMVAQHLAVRHPQRVKRLVLACTSSGGAGGSSFDLLTVNDLPPDERLRIIMPIMDSRNDMTTDPPTIAPGLGWMLTREAEQAQLQAGDPYAEMGARRQLEARQHHDVWADLAALPMPTLCIGGLYDNQAPPENMKRLAGRIPDAELVMCDGGHLFLLQDPTAYPTIAKFLAG